MKKARIALLSLAILGTVGATLAFKASNKFGGIFYCATNGGSISDLTTYAASPAGQNMFCTTKAGWTELTTSTAVTKVSQSN